MVVIGEGCEGRGVRGDRGGIGGNGAYRGGV